MAKLYFHYSTMNAGKSTVLLQAAHNYVERGMVPYLLTAQFDRRAGDGRIASRIGIGQEADTYAPGEDLFAKIKTRMDDGPCACIFVDEAQFLEAAQVWQLARAVDDLHVPIMCFGLRVDFRGELFPGSATLLALADEMREVRTICHCGKKATMVVRIGTDGAVTKDGAQVQIGGNETYVSLCRRHWREEVGDTRLNRRGPAGLQCIRPPFGTGWSGDKSTIAPFSSGRPRTSTSDMKGPIWRGGKLTTPIT